MATKAAQDKLRKPLAITTSDRWGNEVICARSTWCGHIEVDHPEMVGRQSEVIATLADPHTVYPSTVSGSAFIFESSQDAVEIRVVVTYDDPSAYSLGGTIGKINTTFPVDDVTYDAPHIGPPVYKRPAAATPAPSPSADDDEATKKKGGE